MSYDPLNNPNSTGYIELTTNQGITYHVGYENAKPEAEILQFPDIFNKHKEGME